MSNKTLRELAKDYARGEIDKDDYRKSRVELITAITAGEVNVKAIDFPPPLMPSGEEAAITETAKRDKTEIVSTPSKKRPTTNSSPSNQQPSSERKKNTADVYRNQRCDSNIADYCSDLVLPQATWLSDHRNI